ncbi:Response regulator protein VraR [Corynebacterium glaucum]|uniref:Response regulator protein VraR n=1 Tax=Corynebacterium glaucum TaxID=187491 RepID=A0A1Q2HTG5_9CORY|nr:response regulator transcription factor [Corynebacterium glaucum]AQQ14135.1 Response regulator protein VraR [Corynebacterium glaucum]WJZ06657.1 Response regulator protein VraR [Corynebacterium glaucum]
MITVALLDDETLVANSLATLISLEDDIDVVHVAYSAHEFLTWWSTVSDNPETRPDVVVTDLQLSSDHKGDSNSDVDGAGMDGVAVAARIDAGVVVVTSHARPGVVKRALAAGVLGVLPKTSSAEDFAAAIRAAHAGKRHIDPELAAATIAAGDSPLTEREAEVLLLAGRGGSIDAIAEAAHLAPGTTRNYVSSAIAKTGAANRFEAYTIALERGWL